MAERAAIRPVTIKVRENGPLKVTGPVELIDHEGTPIEHHGRDVLLCRCGASADQPFCDRSHRALAPD